MRVGSSVLYKEGAVVKHKACLFSSRDPLY
jgi:hypothetical protein